MRLVLVQDPKGKAIAAPAPDVPAIQVLFGLLGSTLCLRSNSHLILALHLLEIIMGACKQQPARPAGGSRELPMVPENEEPSPAPGTAQAAAGAEPSNVPMEGATRSRDTYAASHILVAGMETSSCWLYDSKQRRRGTSPARS